MTLTEFKYLYAFYKAKWNAPRNFYTGRRLAKSKAKATGQVLKRSRIMSMNVETQHFQRKVY